MDTFAVIADERRHLADDLDARTDEQWTTPSCCAGWTVEDVAAHLTVVWNYSARRQSGGASRCSTIGRS